MNTNTQIDKIDKVLSKISGKEMKAFVKMLKQLKSYGWEFFKGKVAFDLDKAIKDVENLEEKNSFE